MICFKKNLCRVICLLSIIFFTLLFSARASGGRFYYAPERSSYEACLLGQKPALDGPISTIQWEGWQEGVNDVRYLSTLLKLIEEAKTKDETRSLALENERWLKEVKLTGDLDLVRKEMVRRILQFNIPS